MGSKMYKLELTELFFLFMQECINNNKYCINTKKKFKANKESCYFSIRRNLNTTYIVYL